jgi:hypothetical protein
MRCINEARSCHVEDGYIASVLRDATGNPFHPVTVSPAWQTAQVVALAQAAYDQRQAAYATSSATPFSLDFESLMTVRRFRS